MKDIKEIEALKRAIKILGNQRKTARLLGVGQTTVSQWVVRKSLPPKYALIIEKLTGGLVTRFDLCPNIYVD